MSCLELKVRIMAEKRFEFICVDFQKEFADVNGKYYCKGDSVNFIINTLIPFFVNKKIIINEIVSDYRQPRQSKSGSYCIPGDEGFESLIPQKIKKNDVWIKAMHNPTWVRKNGGMIEANPGLPFPNPDLFTKWLQNNIGFPSPNLEVVIFGETLDVCIYSLSQELYFRGYKVSVIFEATDPMNERLDYKETLAFYSGLTLYSSIINFEELCQRMTN